MNEFDRYLNGPWAPGPDTPSDHGRHVAPTALSDATEAEVVQPPLEDEPGRLADVWQWYFEKDRDKDAAFEHGLLSKELAILLLLFIVATLRNLYL